ncbi:MAG: hypothetical protein IJQ32_04405 [Paludibacteraceae bacterium]|nr:hypothetical protein [Paludibacteraceae bacterium]
MANEKKICAKFKGWWKSLDKAKVLIGVFVVLIAGLISASIILYMCYFCGGISSDHKRWSEFGDYIAGIAGMLNVIAFVVLTVMIHTIENHQKDRNAQSHATELVLREIQSQMEILDELYLPFQSYALKRIKEEESKLLASETYERLQPLMVYVGCMKNTKLLPEETKKLLGDLHDFLVKASNVFLCYALDIEEDNGEKMTFTNALMQYHELYRLLVKLEVTLTEDISGVEQEEDQSWKEREERDNNPN